MKKTLLTVLSVCIFALPAAAAEGVVDVQSDFDVQETVERMVNLLNEKGMTVFNRIDHSEGAGKAGIDLRGTVLIIFGNPKVGSPLMKCRQSIAIDLPQKALVREDEKGKVWISYNAPAYLVKRHDVAGCEEVVHKIEKALSGITKAAATR